LEYANDVCELKTKETGQKVEYANDVCELKTKETGQKSGICEMEYAKCVFLSFIFVF
jgi:hypothetical protein